MRLPQLMVKRNNGESFAAYLHVKRTEWRVIRVVRRNMTLYISLDV